MGGKQKVEHKISYYKVRVSTGGVQTRWLGGSVLMVYTNNAVRLVSGFISVCLETRLVGHLCGIHVPERSCTPVVGVRQRQTLRRQADVCVCMCVCACVHVYVYICLYSDTN